MIERDVVPYRRREATVKFQPAIPTAASSSISVPTNEYAQNAVIAPNRNAATSKRRGTSRRNARARRRERPAHQASAAIARSWPPSVHRVVTCVLLISLPRPPVHH